MDNSSNIEQLVKLKDGRTIHKTNNGFTSWLTTAKGDKSEVTSEYYKQAFKNKVNKFN